MFSMMTFKQSILKPDGTRGTRVPPGPPPAKINKLRAPSGVRAKRRGSRNSSLVTEGSLDTECSAEFSTQSGKLQKKVDNKNKKYFFESLSEIL
mmetsp:Transcript_19403/g.18752  ORF Transcript_19403/g.18752 Transcript_19403/m.18752 type:complete len:94 (+) Transcript_19403:398-679(+)